MMARTTRKMIYVARGRRHRYQRLSVTSERRDRLSPAFLEEEEEEEEVGEEN